MTPAFALSLVAAPPRCWRWRNKNPLLKKPSVQLSIRVLPLPICRPSSGGNVAIFRCARTQLGLLSRYDAGHLPEQHFSFLPGLTGRFKIGVVDHDLGDRIPVNCLIAKRDYLLLVSRGDAATTQNRAHVVSLRLSDPDHNLIPNFVRGPVLILGENEKIMIGLAGAAMDQQHVAGGKKNHKEEKGYDNCSNFHRI